MATLGAARAEIASPVAGEQPQLRVLTCGSVDDGKSTLLGRLLFDSSSVLEDQVAALDAESRRWGTQGKARDYALLLDGLSAEREQGITIDVAYRYFSTKRRSFILIDAPGHEQYTRNMATGASQADLAIVLVDARNGILPQTRRHATIASILGVGQVVLAVNKMDLVDWSEARFEAIATAFGSLAASLGLPAVRAVPISAKGGDNVVTVSPSMPWYRGPALLSLLETAPSTAVEPGEGGLLPVQLVLRPDAEFRGYAGTVASGALRPGERVVALPGGQEATITRVVSADGDLEAAQAGQAVTVTLDRQIDVARGDVIARAPHPAAATQTLVATLLWVGDTALEVGRAYRLQLGTATATATVAAIRHRRDLESDRLVAANSLAANEIGTVVLALDRPLAAASYRRDRALGGLILVERIGHATAALGVVESTEADAARPRTSWRRRLEAPVIAGLAIATAAGVASQDPALACGLGLANAGLFLALENRALKRERG